MPFLYVRAQNLMLNASILLSGFGSGKNPWDELKKNEISSDSLSSLGLAGLMDVVQRISFFACVVIIGAAAVVIMIGGAKKKTEAKDLIIRKLVLAMLVAGTSSILTTMFKLASSLAGY